MPLPYGRGKIGVCADRYGKFREFIAAYAALRLERKTRHGVYPAGIFQIIYGEVIDFQIFHVFSLEKN